MHLLEWLARSKLIQPENTKLSSMITKILESGCGGNNCVLKDKFIMKPCLTAVDFNQASVILAFRTRNYRLPVETARWRKH